MCACKDDQSQTTTKVNEQSNNREVNCIKEWILDELKPDSIWRSPTFTSRSEGVRSLDWKIELRHLKKDDYAFVLFLLTDINDEIEVNHSFSIEEIDGVILKESTKQDKFHKCNKVGQSELFSCKRLKPGPLKIKFELSYVDSIRVLDLEKSVMVLLGNLGNILVDPKFSDLTLCVKDKEFKVHKAILAARSPVFAERFKQGLKDNKLDMGDFEPETVQEMLKFIYTGISPNLHKMAQELLIVADYFELKTLKKKTEFELIGTITHDNANDLLLLAGKCYAPELKERVEKFLADNQLAKKDEKYFKDLPEYFGHMSLYPKSTDLTLSVQGKEFKVHKNILSDHSSVFADMFIHETKEKIEIKDLEPDTVEEMLKFIYTGSAPNLTKMAEKLLIAADRFKLEILKKKAEFELGSTISVANAKDLLLLADKCSVPELKKRVEKFLADNAEFAKKDEKYFKDELLDYLGSFSLNTESTDVTLCVRGEEFRAHKNILSSHSSVFADMFKSDTKEKLENRVEIDNLEPETVLEMLKYIYTGNLPKMMEKLLIAADRYKLKRLKADAEFKLIRTITHDNAKELLVLADKRSTSELKDKVEKFLADNAEFAMKSEKYFKDDELPDYLGRLSLHPKPTDVILCVKGKEFKAHKNLLSSQSPAFESIFKQESKDKLENRVEIDDLEPETVEEMLTFIYTGEAPNLHKMADKLLFAAYRYELEMLKIKAEIELLSSISVANAKDLLVLADKCFSPKIKKRVKKFLVDNESEKYFRDLGNMLEDSKFSDLTLCVRDKEFKVHKTILATISPVFAERFKQELKDNKLDMEDMDPDTVQEMLKFIYTGISPNLHKMADKLLIAADRYQLEMLKKKAEFELICTITRDNAKELVVLADKCSAPKLKNRAKKFFLAPDYAEFRKKMEEYLGDELPDYLGRLSVNPQLTDVKLCVKGEEFWAHKNILSSRSSVFESMFKQESKNKLENRVEIDDLEPETVEEMLYFIYTRRAPNFHKMAKDLLIAADRYQIELLKEMAEDELIISITRDNAKELLVLADKCSASELKDKVEKFLAPDNAEFGKKSEDYELPDYLGRLSLHPNSTDVILCVKGKEFKAHKNLLSSQSPVFESMFKQESKDKPENRVELHDLEPETVEEMLSFIYTGRTPNLRKMARKLLIAADRYKLKTLKTIAGLELFCTINVANAKKLLLLANKYSVPNLWYEVVTFLARKKSEKDLKDLQDVFCYLLHDPQLTDVTLCVKGQEFKAHKRILSSLSSVFADMFKQEPNKKPNLENRVNMDDLEPDTVSEMLKFIYTGSAPNLTKMADKLLIAAACYKLEKLMEMAENHLISTISLNNALKLLVLAEKQSAGCLYKKTSEFIKANVKELRKTQDWEWFKSNDPRLD